MRHGIDEEALVDGVITKPTVVMSAGSSRVTEEAPVEGEPDGIPESRPVGFVR